jgi:hypothetical protein
VCCARPAVLVYASVERADNIRVRQPRHGSRFSIKAPQRALVSTEVPRQQLDGDVRAELFVAREKDFRHATRAKAARKPVAACERRRGRHCGAITG